MVGGLPHTWTSCFKQTTNVLLMCALIGVAPVYAESYLVKDQAAYRSAVKSLQPGDELVLANGNWTDFEIVFEAQGAEGKPITLRAQTPGKVIIDGRSNLQIAGDHLVISGLTFKDGYSPTKNVVAFRVDGDRLANHSRLSQTVIDGFNKPRRSEGDHWIALSGKNNRVDHNYFAGKTNRGPTLIVRLDTPESRDNNHRVDHNFFGHRPSIGGNGGETIRIGVSDFSRTQSRTNIQYNYFERCDGEVEIISIKSEGNLVAENMFYESRGAVVFRHGGGNQVSRNIFFGNGVSDTGGVRVINEKQIVKENYFEGLRGEKFLSALTIMNGVPNSPINRYHQVKDSEVSNNSFVGFVSIGLAVGSDEERSAAPEDNSVSNNLFVTDSAQPVQVFDDISGISFQNNRSANPAMAPYASVDAGEIELARAGNGLLYPVKPELAKVGAPRDLEPLSREDTGPEWFAKPEQTPEIGRERRVGKGAAALLRAVKDSRPGDRLKLRGKRYDLKQPIVIPHPLTITGQTRHANRTLLSSEGALVFELRAGGALELSDVELLGQRGNRAVIAATGESYRGAYSLKLSNTDVYAAPGVTALPFLVADDATFATSIEFDRVTATGWPGSFVSLSGTKLDGWYLAEDIKIRNSTFARMNGALVSFGREGRDESTFGPRFSLEDTTLAQVNPQGAAIDLKGIDGLVIDGNHLRDSGALRIKKRVLGLRFVVQNNALIRTASPEVLGVEDEPIGLGTLVEPSVAAADAASESQ